MKNFFLKPRALNIAQQLVGLKAAFPDGAGELKQHRLFWRMMLSPTPLSQKYYLDLEYADRDIPKVFVKDPCLADMASGRKIPHLYEQNPARLCLYLPGHNEWTSDRPFYRTLVPWAALWLFYFEDWLISGEWLGGGLHPKTSANSS